MMKRKWKKLLATTLAVTMVMGMSISALAADGETLAVPTGGDATAAPGEGGIWQTVNDDDTLAGATDTDGAQIGVFAKVNIAGASVYKVDIAWGQMKFSYSNTSRRWDPDTHKYIEDNDGSVGWTLDGYVDATNNKVTVTNHSNEAISAGFAYAHSLSEGKSLFNETPSGIDAVRGFFFEDNAAARTAAAVLTNSATVASALAAPITIVKCPENATTETVPKDDVFFTLNGTPDPESINALGGEAFTRVGIITVTITSTV